MKPTKEELALAVDLAEWGTLKAHLQRDGLIVVTGELDLVEAGFHVAADNPATIQGWIDTGKLAKPSVEQIAAWNAATDKKFRMIIISPYILIQEQQ